MTGQHALLACGMQEDGNEEIIPPEQLCKLNVCNYPGGEGGEVTLTRQQLPTACSQGKKGEEGDPLTQQRTPLACGHEREEEWGPPT